MGLGVQAWVEDMSTEGPTVTHCYGGGTNVVPDEGEVGVLADSLSKQFGKRVRVERDPDQNLVWFYVQVPEWTPDDHYAALAAGYVDAGCMESYDEEDAQWLFAAGGEPAVTAPARATLPGMGFYDDIERELNLARDSLAALTAKINPEAELDDVACDDIGAGLDDLDEVLLALRKAVGSRRVELHRDQV